MRAFCSYYYIELHLPYRNDYNPSYRGVAVRMMGDMADCTSTRAVPTHVADGQAQYLLSTPDPDGLKLGSKFEDPLRQVRVVLERWERGTAVVRVWAG